MDRLNYTYPKVDMFVADRFVERNSALKAADGIPEYTTNTVEFSLVAINYAEYYYKFPPENYEKAKQLIADTNMKLLLRSEQCVSVIKKTRCWENPVDMFTAMKRVRDLLELQSNLLDFQNPDTGEWS